MPRKIESGLFSNPMTTPDGGVMLQQGSSEGAGQLADLSKNKLLMDEDVIRVAPYTNRVAVKGAIKKEKNGNKVLKLLN
jgi:hypothetical protein